MNQQIKAVVFDLDGTLTDTEKFYLIAWPKAMAKYGYEMTRQQVLDIRSLGRPYAPEFLKEISGDPEFDYQKIRAYRMELMEELLADEIPLKHYAKEILAGLHNKGILVALGTANNRERAERYLKRIGLFEYFDKIICADMVKRGKPDPDIYEFAAKELAIPKEQIYVVEDSPNGVNSAYAAGLKVIMIPDLSEPEPELLPHIHKVYSSLEEFYMKEFN